MAAGALATACAGLDPGNADSAAMGGTPQVTIGKAVDSIGSTTVEVAREKGYFAKAGAKVKQQLLSGSGTAFAARLVGELVTCYLFPFRLSYSGKAVHRVFASAGQEAFFEGHVHALRTLGGVPRSKVRYENLKAAVARVLGLSRARVEADRWIAFKSHYGIESFYSRPGIEGAHEKGGAEGQIGYFRRNHFVPVPEVSSLAELNEMVDLWDRQDEARRIGSRSKTIAECFALERPLLRPLPDEPFETGRLFTPRVDRYGQIPVRTNRYSVPIRLIGRRVRVVLHPRHLRAR